LQATTHIDELMIATRHFITLRSFGFSKRGLASVGSSDDLRIPVVNFSKFRRAATQSQKKSTADEVVGAFKDSGFVYLSEHGISAAVVNNTFAKSAQFFSLPLDVKSKFAWEVPQSNRGYVAFGRERVTQSADAAEIAALRAKAPDSKESMEIGRDWDSEWLNRWPHESDAPGFKTTMLDFYKECHNLHVQVMRCIAIGLELDEKFFDDKINLQCHNLRLLSYPPIKRALLDGEGQARAGAHSDYGTLTLLFQDSVGGLEVQNPHNKNFQPAAPIPGTIVVNVGDLLARWSNDILRSTLHRVVAPPVRQINDTEAITPRRQSIAFFCNPNFDAKISCLPNCSGPGMEAKYGPVTTEEYIVGRLADTYS